MASKNCTVCEEAINPRRLAAIPDATRCVGCQPAFDLDPREAFSPSKLQAVSVEMAEGDGDHRMAGGSSSCYFLRDEA